MLPVRVRAAVALAPQRTMRRLAKYLSVPMSTHRPTAPTGGIERRRSKSTSSWHTSQSGPPWHVTGRISSANALCRADSPARGNPRQRGEDPLTVSGWSRASKPRQLTEKQAQLLTVRLAQLGHLNISE